MAFDLPRGPCSLRFTGSLRALAPAPTTKPAPAKTLAPANEETAAAALGQARPKAAPPSASVPAPSLPSSRLTTPTRLTTLRGHVEFVPDNEDLITECLDRNALVLAVLPDPRFARDLPTGVAMRPNLPVPHFRSAAVACDSQRTVIIPRRRKVVAPPLAVWLVAAIVAGILSFYLAPMARASLQEAVRGTDSQ